MMMNDYDTLKEQGYKMLFLGVDEKRMLDLDNEKLKEIRNRIHKYLGHYLDFKFDMQNDYNIRPFECCDRGWVDSLQQLSNFASTEIRRRRGTLSLKTAYVDTKMDIILTYEPNPTDTAVREVDRESLHRKMTKEEIAIWRTKKYYRFNGNDYSIRQLVKIANEYDNDLDYSIIYSRLKKGWGVEEAITTPKGRY